jgi:hypothetical protein
MEKLKVRVYYVTAMHGEQGRRHQLGKFPAVDGDLVAETAAQSFAKSLPKAYWRNIAVETKEEPLEAQHVAHGGNVGA